MAVNYFRIKASDIRDSLAPAYYNNLMTQSYHNKYPYFTLIKKVDIVNTQIKASTKKYIGLENIEGHTNQLTGEITTRTFSSAHNFESNQILFSKLRPYLNKVWYANFDGVCSTEFHILDIKDKLEILPKYLSIYLSSNTVVTHLTNIMGGNTLPRIQRSDLENLQIPLPPMKIQQEIADIMDHAYTEKQRLESEARELLNSIDSYVMDKLGIEQTQQITTTNKWFTVKASDIRGNRWDPRNILIDSNIQSIFDILPLGELITVSSGKICKFNKDRNKLSYKVYGANGVIGSFSEYNIKKDTLLIGRVGSVGSLKITPENIWATDNVLIVSFKNTKLYQNYLYYYLQSINLSNYAIGSNQPVISGQRLYEIPIPLPPIEIQKEIALECETRRNTAQENQKLAQDILAKAKADVEKMLFGE